MISKVEGWESRIVEKNKTGRQIMSFILAFNLKLAQKARINNGTKVIWSLG
jgi:hypothetical protein